jgi:23S rRNA (adenine2503-C2)-methyltransferase
MADRPSEKVDLKNLPPAELLRFIASSGKERYRAVQLLRWLYKAGATSVDEMTNLSRAFREDLKTRVIISRLRPLREQEGADGTRKSLFELDDGNRIESVLIPDRDRLTLCISTQVGCAMGCRFCLTGKRGWKRDLTTAEILNQVLAARDGLPPGKSITNIVLMGMGEPLANYENVMKALEILLHPEAFKFSSRRVTLSTVGLLPEMERLATSATQVRLAVSLNATEDETRSGIMPVNRRYPLKDLLAACRAYPLRPRTRITFEYVLLAGVNDTPGDARRLVGLLRGIPSKINLIPLNEAPGIPFRRPLDEEIQRFQEILMKAGLTAIVRQSKGSEISGACGQLSGSVPEEPIDRPGEIQ